mmetsp:Transcript_102570/g.290536  ORF Transcript_102570/g.290536 Transcript_102570/m.290536 type:complete len:221 (-) Transcript_102570:153-815(-)
MIIRISTMAHNNDFIVAKIEYTSVRSAAMKRMRRCRRKARVSRTRRASRTFRNTAAPGSSSSWSTTIEITSIVISSNPINTTSVSVHAQNTSPLTKKLVNPSRHTRASSSTRNSTVYAWRTTTKTAGSSSPRWTLRYWTSTPLTSAFVPIKTPKKNSNVWPMASLEFKKTPLWRDADERTTVAASCWFLTLALAAASKTRSCLLPTRHHLSLFRLPVAVR